MQQNHFQLYLAFKELEKFKKLLVKIYKIGLAREFHSFKEAQDHGQSIHLQIPFLLSH